MEFADYDNDDDAQLLNDATVDSQKYGMVSVVISVSLCDMSQLLTPDVALMGGAYAMHNSVECYVMFGPITSAYFNVSYDILLCDLTM